MGTMLGLEIESSAVENFTLQGTASPKKECLESFRSQSLTEIELNSANKNSETATLQPVPLKKLLLRKGEVAILEDFVLDSGECASAIEKFEVQERGGSLATGICSKEDITCYHNKSRNGIVFSVNCTDLHDDAVVLLEVRDFSSKPFSSAHSARTLTTGSDLDTTNPDITSPDVTDPDATDPNSANPEVPEPPPPPPLEIKQFTAFVRALSVPNCHCHSLDIQFVTTNPLEVGSELTIYFAGSYILYACSYPQSGFTEVSCTTKQLVLTMQNKYESESTFSLSSIHIDMSGFSSLYVRILVSDTYGNSQSLSTDMLMGTRDSGDYSLSVNSKIIIVMEPSVFWATFSPPCIPTGNLVYTVRPYTGTQISCYSYSDCREYGSYIQFTAQEVEGVSRTLMFIMTGPTNTKILNELLSVSVYDEDLGYTVFSINLLPVQDVQLIPSTIPSVKISVASPEAKTASVYTFTVQLKHPVPSLGRLEIIFNPQMAFDATLVCEVNSEEYPCTHKSNSVFINSLKAVAGGTVLEVKVDGVISPEQEGIYTDLCVKIKNKDDDVLAKSRVLFVSVYAQDSEADISSIITHTKVFKELRLTFIFSPKNFTGAYTNSTYFSMSIASPTIECSPPDTFSSNLKRVEDYKFKVSGDADAPLEVGMTCKEPSTDIHGFEFEVVEEDTKNRIRGKKEIVISKGVVPLAAAFSLECSNEYPLLRTLCRLTFTRSTSDPIGMVVLHGELLNTSAVYGHLPFESCGVGVLGSGSVCSYHLNAVFVVPESPIDSSTFTITGFEFVNPNMSEKEEKKITMRTFRSAAMYLEDIVDQADETIVAAVKCDFPCNSCKDNFTTCTSCVIGGETEYYLDPFAYKCGASCPPKTYPDANRVCSSCMEHCEMCRGTGACDSCEYPYCNWKGFCTHSCPPGSLEIEGNCEICADKCTTCNYTVNYCTECRAKKFRFEGECYDACIKGTGPVNDSSENYCANCSANCEECEYGENQIMPKICTKCAEGYKLTNKNHSSPSTCISKNSGEDNDYPIPIYTIVSVSIITGAVAIAAIGGATASGTAVGAGVAAGAAGAAGGGAGVAHANAGVTNANNDLTSSSTNNDAQNDSSSILVVNYLLLACYATLLYRSVQSDNLIIILTVLAALAISLVMNLMFVFKVLKKVKDEVKGVLYGGSLNKPALVLVFSTLCTFQTTRLFFGSFKGLKLFSMSEEYSVELRQPLNKYSIVQAILVNLPVIGVAALELIRLSSGTKLYTSILDSSALSVLFVILLFRESIKDQADVMRIKLKVIDRIKDVVFKRIKAGKSAKGSEELKTKENTRTNSNGPADSSRDLPEKDKDEKAESISFGEEVKTGTLSKLESEDPFVKKGKPENKDIRLLPQSNPKSLKRIKTKEKRLAQKAKPNSQQDGSNESHAEVLHSNPSVSEMLNTESGRINDKCIDSN